MSKLSDAKVCVECEEIFFEGDQCPKCTCTAWGYVNHWMTESHKTIAALMEALKTAKAQLEKAWKATGGRV